MCFEFYYARPSLTAYTPYFMAYTVNVYPLETIYLCPFSIHVVEEHVAGIRVY